MTHLLALTRRYYRVLPSLLTAGLINVFPAACVLLQPDIVADSPTSIDVRHLLSGTDGMAADRTARQMADAASSLGIFYITGCGPLCDLYRTSELFGAAAAVLSAGRDAPGDVDVSVRRDGFVRGYIGVGGESGLVGDFVEVKEGFSYGYPWDGGGAGSSWPPPETELNSMQGPNVWPAEKDGAFRPWHRGTLEESFDEFTELAGNISRALLKEAGSTVDDSGPGRDGGETISLVRIFRYLPCASTEMPGASPSMKKIGSSAHTDWGTLTLILQDDAEQGLEYLHAGVWRPVPHEEKALVVVAGDLLSLMSGGKYRSPVHRVQHGNVERTSFVFFLYPDYGADMPAVCSAGSDAGANSVELQEDVRYNTLTVQGDECAANATFGKWISKKWAGVQEEPP
eukprot:CAMPEP_0194339160 /NCGR_PEP_ID=MMETSP0171-20130528/82039_1 /TAXON_ID=218684 /ORGANISM="Corethron pennatum, Strain L29A3" /LENGTH=398 /DNA_ID=CAMNT_0039103571 /DNA_START=117 /DNA_END=1313 /DNA_ORIENTATION=-